MGMPASTASSQLRRQPAQGGHGAGRIQNISSTERLMSLGAGLGLALIGLSKGRLSGWALAAIGGGLLHRGITGHCYGYEMLGINTAERPEATAIPAQQGVRVEKSITINRPAEELFQFWRNLENLPQVMRHLKQVTVLDNNRSHWVVDAPLRQELEWYAEVYNEKENEMIAWRSLPGSDVETAGSVHFKPLDHDRGTVVTINIKYNPPGGKAGDVIASLLGVGLPQQIEEDLRRFKFAMEAGEIPTISGQPRGA